MGIMFFRFWDLRFLHNFLASCSILEVYLQHFGVRTFHFPLCLQYFGAQTFHVAWYFATRVHLRLGYGCFKAYFGLVLGWFRIKKRRSREAEKSRKAEKKKT